jgi:hypothetical protein
MFADAQGIMLFDGTGKEKTPINLLPHHLYLHQLRIVNWPKDLDAPYPSRPSYKQSELAAAIKHILDPVMAKQTRLEKWSAGMWSLAHFLYIRLMIYPHRGPCLESSPSRECLPYCWHGPQLTTFAYCIMCWKMDQKVWPPSIQQCHR